MSAAGPPRDDAHPDTRPAALLVGGLRRGALVVFLPVFAVGQLLAFAADAVTGWYGVWSWVQIGSAESLTSVRVAFDALGTGDTSTGPSAGRLVVATGALTIAVLVLSFRAGREQGRGLELRPAAAALAGSTIGLGFAVPALITALPVSLQIDRFGIERLEPVVWQALILPLGVAGAAGAVGGLARARERLADGDRARVLGAIEGGAIAFWWGVVLAFVGILLAATLSPRPVGAYARILDHAGATGASAVIQQALLLPNASVLVLATSMGATTTFGLGAEGAVHLTRSGVDATGAAAGFLAALFGSSDAEIAVFPWWFTGFWLVPTVSTMLGGRTAASGGHRLAERVLRGSSSGVVFALLCMAAVWAAGIRIPTVGLGPSVEAVTIGASPLATSGLALVWGMVGGAAGGAVPWPASLNVGRARPR